MTARLRRRGIMAASRRRLWTPASIAGLDLWLDASQLGLADGASVATFTDLSGNGRDLTQATSSARPTFRSSGSVVTQPNGLPVVHFDGVDDFLANTAYSVASVPAGGTTVLVVTRSLSSGVNSEVVTTRSGVAVNDGWLLRLSSGGASVLAALIGSLNATVSGTTTSVHIAGLDRTGGSQRAFINGSNGTAVSGTLTAPATTLTQMGKQSSVISGQMYVAECIVYSSKLSDADRQTLESYLRAKWGTP